jgi:hypothetical protein
VSLITPLNILSFSFRNPGLTLSHSLPPVYREWRVYTSFEHRPKDWHDQHRTCIYARTHLRLQDITQLSDGGQLLLGLDVSLPSAKKIRLINVYNTPRTFPAIDVLHQWLTSHNSRQIPTFLFMDANLHHPHWNPPGLPSNHRRARDLLGLCGKLGLCMASPGKSPLFIPQKKWASLLT